VNRDLQGKNKEIGGTMVRNGMLVLGMMVAAAAALVLNWGESVRADTKKAEDVKEMLLMVDEKIITLPAGAVSRLPMSAVRVRSDKLRKVNKECNAVSIEPVYMLKDSSEAGVSGMLSSEEKEEAKMGPVTKIRRMMRRVQEAAKAKGKAAKLKMVPVKNTFIIRFEKFKDEKGIERVVDLAKAIEAYKDVSVVVNARVSPFVEKKVKKAETVAGENAGAVKKPKKDAKVLKSVEEKKERAR